MLSVFAVGGCGGEPSTEEPVHSSSANVIPPCLDPCTQSCPSVIDVKTAFGAVGDGVSDDYGALVAAANYASANAGTTLVFPAGTYKADRYIGGTTNVGTHIRYHDVSDIHLVGCGATVAVKGDIARTSSAVRSIVPFYFESVSNFSMRGFTLQGNVQQMTRSAGVTEAFSHGIATSNCQDYSISDVTVSGFSADGILVGAGAPFQVVNGQNQYRADRNVFLHNVVATGNARQGLTISQARNVFVSDSTFSDQGRVGAYGGHSPQAGVDIEPNYSGVNVDIQTGEIEFLNSSFLHNVGSQFEAPYRTSTDSVILSGANVVASPDSSPYTVILAVPDGAILDSQIDTGGGAVYANWGTSTAPADFLMRDTQVTTSGHGVVATGANIHVAIEDCVFTGQQTTSGTYMPYIQAPNTTFVGNTVFMPKAAYGPNTGAAARTASLVQGVALSSLNTFQTDLVPGQPALPGGAATPAGAYFLTSYNASLVAKDNFVSGTAYRPCGSCWVTGTPYSQ
jgi:hypothetical protein